jgi:hypothetical protein
MTPRHWTVRPSRRQVLRALMAGILGFHPDRPTHAQPVPPPPARPAAPTAPATPGRPAPTPPATPARPSAAPPPAAPAPADPRPGSPAPSAVVEEIRVTLGRALERFEARDAEGVLAHVSEEYRTGPLTKRTVRAQLLTILQVHHQVRARVQVDAVRLVGAHAWVWTTGEMTGQLALVGTWVRLFVWDGELEIARREQGAWRLYGYQQ